MLPSSSSNSSTIYRDQKLSELIGKAFYDLHWDIEDQLHDEYWLKGGRGSLKSSFTAIKILQGIVRDPYANAVATRKVGDTIGTSVLPTFQWAISALGWESQFHVIKSPATATFIRTGQQIIMKGLDDPLKLKSIKPARGYFKYLWNEEGAEYTDLEEIESVVQSVLRGGEKSVHFVTYNPPVEPKAWINVESRIIKPNRLVHESNYTQAPPEWLGPKFLADAAEMARSKPDKYAHVYMGAEIGRSEAIIFSGCYAVDGFTVEQRGHKYFINDNEVSGPYFGADWGFATDPTTLVKCWLCEETKTLYIEYEAVGVGVMLDHTPALFDQIPDSRRYKIRADCSRPETIAHIKAAKFNIEAADKWSGSVEDGITWLKSYKIVIHQRCAVTQEEAIKYSYKIDRVTREVLADIVSKHDHCWDAIRYAFAPMIKPKPKGLFGSGILVQK